MSADIPGIHHVTAMGSDPGQNCQFYIEKTAMPRRITNTSGIGTVVNRSIPEIEIQRQTAFGEDGQLEVTETSIETSLEDFGADIDHRDRDSRLDRPEANEFGVDDRPEVKQSAEDEQSTLFADTDEDQQTHTGDKAAARCLFEE